jgi:hypothetical protein
MVTFTLHVFFSPSSSFFFRSPAQVGRSAVVGGLSLGTLASLPAKAFTSACSPAYGGANAAANSATSAASADPWSWHWVAFATLFALPIANAAFGEQCVKKGRGR